MFSGVQNTPLRTSVWIEGSLTTGSSENCGILRHVSIIMTVKLSMGLQLYLSLDSFETFLGEEERYFSSIFPVFFVSLQWPQKFYAGQEKTFFEDWNCRRESTRRLDSPEVLWKRYSLKSKAAASLLKMDSITVDASCDFFEIFKGSYSIKRLVETASRFTSNFT